MVKSSLFRKNLSDFIIEQNGNFVKAVLAQQNSKIHLKRGENCAILWYIQRFQSRKVVFMIQKPRGTMDILPEDVATWHYIENTARRVAKTFGFNEIRFPTFESTELFQRGVGGTTDVVQKEMYTFTDRENRSFTLRPEGTACVVRSLIENGK